MKERVLHLSLTRAVDQFQGLKWLFYSVEGGDSGCVKLEVPRHSDESFVVEVAYENLSQLEEIEGKLKAYDWIRQTIRRVSDQ